MLPLRGKSTYPGCSDFWNHLSSLRDIAAAAEVDVAYVHRSFGSKAEIFRHALAALDPLDDIMVATDGRSMISRLCDLAFLRDPRIQEAHISQVRR